jgi:2-keto-4-pentenoate hydratase
MNFLTEPAITRAANILLERRTSGTTGSLLPQACRPGGLDDAFAIQAALSARIGARIAGWKCGLPEAGRLVAAPIYASEIHRAGPCLIWPHAGRARIEPELAFMLGQDLPPRATPYTAAEVDAAISHTHLALELIASRYDDPDAADFADKLADGLLNQGLYLGPEVDAGTAQAATTLALQIRVTGEADIALDGRHPAGQPRAPLYWLAEFLRSTGQGLQAGQVVITGSYAGCLAMPMAQDITLSFGQLGSLSTRFIAR